LKGGSVRIFRVGTLVLAVVLSLTVPAGGAEAHTKTYAVTKLGINYHHAVHGFYGKLHTHTNCRGGRTIKVFLQKPGPDTLVGSDTTPAQGTYSVYNGNLLTGGFYAITVLVHRNSSGHHHTCLGKRSLTLYVGHP
jgi:hypothetical protein